MTSITNNFSLPNPSQGVKSGDNLGKDEFMKLLLIQLQNQDPTNPVDDREFISQMATFSSLEQMTNMNKTLETFVESQAKQTLMQYSELINKEVTYEFLDPNSVSGEQRTAKVTSVKYDKDRVLQIGLDDGTWILEKQINAIADATKAQTND